MNFAALGSGGQTWNIGTLEWVLKRISDLEKEEKPDEQWNEDDNAGLTQILEDVLGNSAICRYGICTPAQVAAYMKTMVKAIKLMKHFNH